MAKGDRQAGAETVVWDKWLRPRGDEGRERFEDARNKLVECLKRGDDLIPSERRIVWEYDLD